MNRLDAAIEALKRGDMVILVDSEDRENEGDLVLAAQFATAEKINFLIRQACGLVCLALEADQVDRLGLPPMVQDNGSPRKTAFTVSVEAARGVSTGISAADRAHTILTASNPASAPKDLVSPGHIFPLKAVRGGVLERAGHTEGSIELCKLAGLLPSAVICEIINEDGSMARKPDLERFSERFGIPIVTIEDLIQHQISAADWMDESRSALFPNRHTPSDGRSWRIRSFRNRITGAEHALIELGPKEGASGSPLVRIHSECLTGDALGSLRCDCGFQLDQALERIQVHGGLLLAREHAALTVYLQHLRDEVRGLVEVNDLQHAELVARDLDDWTAGVFSTHPTVGTIPESKWPGDVASAPGRGPSTRSELG